MKNIVLKQWSGYFYYRIREILKLKLKLMNLFVLSI